MREEITGLVLAGGRARRMGGVDKGLIELAGRPMIEQVVERLRPQVGLVIINANRNRSVYERWSDIVIADRIGDFEGPLAGMAAGLEVADTPWMLAVPCDSPLLPEDLADRLYDQALSEQAEIAVVHDGERIHPVFAMLHRQLLPSLSSFLHEGERKIDRWFGRHSVTTVDFSDQPRAFMNINTLADKSEVLSALNA